MTRLLSEDMLRQVVARIVSVAHEPQKVVLFGSYARADADENSDLDLLVVEREIDDYTREYARLREAVGPLGVGVDLLLCSLADFEKQRDWWASPVYWADREGRVLYEQA